jgi:uncharacterized membrane protein (DUF4010 family)
MIDEMMPFLTALIIGLLIGIERERSKGKDDVNPILGARTFPLLALMGSISAFLNNEILIIFIAGYVSIIILASHIHWDHQKTSWYVSSTTAVAAMLTFILGFLAHSHGQIAIILAIILFGFLVLKARLHSFARTGITKQEMSAALTFLISAFVILPLLPNEFIDPWQLVHPTRIWLLFVIIAGVEFSSYIALKQLGMKWGMLVTGLFGGFASATATTLSLAKRAKEESGQILLITSAIILAEVSSLLMQLVVLSIIAPNVLMNLFLYLAAPAFVGTACALGIGFLKKNQNAAAEVNLKIKNPISLKSTASFALLISAGLILIALATRLFGEAGVYITSAMGGAVSLRVVTFTVSELASSGEILTSIAALSILIAMMVNMFVKLGMVYKVGGLHLSLTCAIFFFIMLASGAAIYFLNLEQLLYNNINLINLAQAM